MSARAISRLPKTTIRAGTEVWHYTSSCEQFHIPSRPTFFTFHRTVKWVSYGDQRDGHSPEMARIMAFRLVDDVEVLNLDRRDTYEKCIHTVLNGESWYPPNAALALDGLANGWATGIGGELMLVHPALWLKPQTELTEWLVSGSAPGSVPMPSF